MRVFGIVVVGFVVGCSGRQDVPAAPEVSAPEVSAPEVAAPEVPLDAALGCGVVKALWTREATELQAAGVSEPTITFATRYRAGEDGRVGTLDDRYLSKIEILERAGMTLAGPEKAALVKLAEAAPCSKVPLQLLAFNDFHGALEPPSGKNGQIKVGDSAVDAGGAEYVATWLKQLRVKDHGNTLIVAAGDNIGATPLLSAAFHDEPTIEALNHFGLALTSVGNHEFDEGLAELTRMQQGGCHPEEGCFGGDGFEGARFGYLAANVVVEATGETAFPPYAIRRFGRVPVAFIGMTLEGTPDVVTAKGVAGLKFKDEAETVNALVPRLKELGVEAIVVLLHEGGFATGRYDGCEGISGPIFDIVKRFDPAVDVVVSGHTNAAHVCDIEGRLVTSAAHLGRLVTDIALELDEATGDVINKSAKNVIVTRDVEKDPTMTAHIARYRELVEDISRRVVGTIDEDLARAPTELGETPLGSAIADAQLFAESDPSTGGAQVALMNPGGIRAELLRTTKLGEEQDGEVTFGEIFSVQPFGNALVTMTLTGAQLEAVLEQQFEVNGKAREVPKMLQVSHTLRYAIRADGGTPGDRIDPATIEIEGKVISPEGRYRVVSNEFLANGGDGFEALKVGTERKIGIVDVDSFELYLRKHPGLKAPAPGRVRRQ